jgi:hypothetical protein
MIPSETGYLFLLAIGWLSLAATVTVAVSAYVRWRRRHLRTVRRRRPDREIQGFISLLVRWARRVGYAQ